MFKVYVKIKYSRNTTDSMKKLYLSTSNQNSFVKLNRT